MIFSEMNCRAQVDLIDIQSQPDGDLKWILVYRDHLTKICTTLSSNVKTCTRNRIPIDNCCSFLRSPRFS